MYPNSPHGNSSRPLPTQNGQNDAYRVNDVQRRRTRSTNPFDYDPYDPSNDDSPPPPLPPRPRGLSVAASSRHQVPQRPPPPPPPLPPHHFQSPPHTAASYTPSAELRPFPRESDSDLSVPSSTTSSNRPSPSYVAARPEPPAYEYEYFNNPWAYPTGAQHQQPGVYDAGGLSAPHDPGLRQRAKSSIDLRSAASLRAPRQPEVSTFVAPTMSFPMPEIPPLPTHPPLVGAAQDRPLSALGRATSAHATLVNGARGSPPSPPRTQPRNSVSSLNNSTTPTSATPTPGVEELEGGRKPRRPSSANSRPGSSRGEFRFSPNLMKLQHMPSVASISSTSTSSSNFYKEADFEDGFASPTDATFSTESLQIDGEELGLIGKELSSLSLDMDENVTRFQKGELPEQDQEWHRLVPEEALKALESTEIKRQGLIFELLKAEREYVDDLVTMEEVFIKGLMESNPPIIRDPTSNARFVDEVFGNLHEILVHHQKMLERLFARQKETHPLIPSIADIVLDTIVKPEFRDAYEKYIKQYPVAESVHQKELKSNTRYRDFLQTHSRQPRVKKRDMKIFLNRPLTRLVRLNLLLEEMHKRTDKDHEHPDVETLPIIRGIVSDCIKATQPGIETAEQKVKFLDLCENIIPTRGEIIDMDLYNPERHLVYTSPVWRKVRSENGFGSDKWQEVSAHLLDNFFILTRDMKTQTGAVKKVIMSRPLPLSFVRLTAFNAPPETRREKVETGSLLDTFRSQDVSLYPFTIYHASPTIMKAYTLYAPSEGVRKKWHASFIDVLSVFKVRQENNQMFAQDTLVDGYFRMPKEPVNSPTMQKATGRITAAVPFATQAGQRYLAIGCASGIYIAPYNRAREMVKVFTFRSPHYLAAIQSVGDKVFNRFVIHVETSIFSYSLELVARFVTGKLEPNVLEASKEKVSTPDQNVLFVRHCILEERVLLVYASKKRLSSSVSIHAVEAIAHSLQRPGSATPANFRPFGQPGYIPKEAYDIVALAKTVNICTKSGLVSAHPGDFPGSASPPVPVLQGDSGSNLALTALKNKAEHAKPLGLVKTNNPEEFLVVYDDLGIYINSRGLPARKCGYLKWETKATSYAHRGGLLLLISPRFIEIHEVGSGKIVQVIEGADIRLLFSDPEITPHDNILLAMRGKYNDNGGVSDKIVELLKTVEIPPQSAAGTPSTASVWSEWDM